MFYDRLNLKLLQKNFFNESKPQQQQQQHQRPLVTPASTSTVTSKAQSTTSTSTATLATSNYYSSNIPSVQPQLQQQQQQYQQAHVDYNDYYSESESLINTHVASNLNDNTFHLSPNQANFYSEELRYRLDDDVHTAEAIQSVTLNLTIFRSFSKPDRQMCYCCCC